MSILSSLFGSRKRAKKPASPTGSSTSPPPSTTKQKVRASSQTERPTGPSRFLSIRRKSSTAAYETAQRRSSVDASRKKQALTAGGGGEEWKLPDLGFAETGASGQEVKSGLGLENVGRVPQLSAEERDRLGSVRLEVEHVAKIWSLLGGIIKDTDLPSCMLDIVPTDLEQQYDALCAIAVLVVQPDTLSNFPSLSSHYPSASTSGSRSVWSDRLLDLGRSITPPAVASTLKWALRRLAFILDKPILSSAAYIKFVQAEHAASYPLDAYQSILAIELAPGTRKVLHELFDVWAALTAHADDQSGLGGKLALIMGWWILGEAKSEDWEDMYAGWRLAGRRVEHLFLAWIRHQSTTHTLPTRLLALVEKYPYGYSEYSAENLPSPPPSSFTRRTLHISLQTDQPLSKLSLSPSDILEAARSAKAADGVEMPIWGAVAGASGPEHRLMDDESTSFLARSGDGPHIPPAVAKKPTPSRQSSLFEGRADPVPLARMPSNSKLLDTLAEEVGKLAESHKPIPSPRKPSSVRTPLPESSSTWDDFTKSGFAEDRDGNLDLALSPSASMATFSSATREPVAAKPNGKALATPTASPSRKTSFAPVAKFTLAKERVIEVDDVFIGFAEDGQLDTASSAKWPIFTLLRLRTPYTPEGEDGAIERLLITVEYRAPAPPPPVTPSKGLLPRETITPPSSSPNGESSFRFGSFGFKRSASRPGFRSSFFSSSRVSLLKDDKGADFITEPETIYKNASARSVGSVDELGMLSSKSLVSSMGAVEKKPRKAVPSFDEPSKSPKSPTKSVVPIESVVEAADASTSPPTAPPASRPSSPLTSLPVLPPASPPVVIDAATALPAQPVPHIATTPFTPGPSTETSPGEWIYGAEGGAHVVFMYVGSSVPYIGKLLRIRKISSHRDDPLEESSAIWRDQLLPRLIPDRLLVKAEGVKVNQEWLEKLLSMAEVGRADERKSKGSLVEEIGTEPKISLMENLRMTDGGLAGTRVMSVEIKPKWGFLPSAESVQPPEAAAIKSKIGRYTLHQHYRGKEPKEGAYDPLDLFSGEEERIKHALVGLWGIWRGTEGQANSFRVFVDGNIVHPDEADTEGNLLQVTAPILIPLLLNSDILPVLRHLQSNLDPTDISDLFARFRAAHPDSPLFDESVVPDIQPTELKAFISKYLSGVSSADWNLRERIIAYSLSAIFKDCSIIIRAVLSPMEEVGKWKVEEKGSTLKLLDLDLKPLKMRHWAELDEKIWRHWAETRGKGGVGEKEAVEGEEVVDGLDDTVVAPPKAEDAREIAAEGTEASTAPTEWVSVPPVPTPGIGSEWIVPGGFPGIPDVPISTPSLDAGPSSATSEHVEAATVNGVVSEDTTRDSTSGRADFAWHLKWYDGLEAASKSYFAEQDVQGMLDVLGPLHEMLERGAETPAETTFEHTYGPDLRTAREHLRKGVTSSEAELQDAWDLYYSRISKVLRPLKLIEEPPIRAPPIRATTPSPAAQGQEQSIPPGPHSLSSPEPTATVSAVPADLDVNSTVESAGPDEAGDNEPLVPNGNGVHIDDKEEGAAEVGQESAYSSALSTPMVPGAFRFPDMARDLSKGDVSPDEEVLADVNVALETTSDIPKSHTEHTSDFPSPSNTFGPSPTSQLPPVLIPDMLDQSPQSHMTSVPAETSSIESTADSPVESRYERSFAPSPSPALATEQSPISPSTAANLTLSSIALNSPTFGNVDDDDIESGSSVTAETIESGSSITEESSDSHSPHKPFPDSPSTPERRGSCAPSSLLGSAAGTPTQRTFPNVAPIALGMPVVAPRSSSIHSVDAHQRAPISLVSSVHSTPSRPERRRVESISQGKTNGHEEHA